MAVLPFRPIPFFANKNQAFWRLQMAGWGGALLLRTMSGLANAKELSFLVLVLISTVTGLSITLILSVVYRGLINRRPIITWGATSLVLTLAVGLYAFIDAWVNALYNGDGGLDFGRVIGLFYLDATLLLAWSALYYMINFFLQIEEQNDQMIQLENQATSAQLAMLRYQLNPHFLFNTLNSISTLVLLKQTERANAMLSRLSSFLRYTLVYEPTAQVTLAQEVETLKLYLEIEKMRFEERLRPEFEIDTAASKARLPSLLLQPLVENAIKYAVTPQEDGADISVAARLIGDRVQITVSDTGSGLNGTVQRPNDSTGVGLANIRDRLAQAYGEDQRIEVGNQAGGGFSVMIDIPYREQETA